VAHDGDGHGEIVPGVEGPRWFAYDTLRTSFEDDGVGVRIRIGELLALRTKDVNFLQRTVEIEHQLSRDGKKLLPPKTTWSKRKVPLPTVVAEALAEHIATYPIESVDGLLFTSARGNPWRQLDYVRRAFRPAAERAGLPAGTGTHDLRHHYVSVLLAAGESVVAVAERLGHKNAKLVFSTYGHLMPGSEDRTRRAIDAAWTTDGRGTDGGDHRETESLASN
jgi:integrase